MKSKHHRFVLLRRIFQPWQWKRRKKRNRFEQTSRTLQRKISMRSTKDQLVEKMFLCRFSSGLHGNTAADSVRSEWPLWHAAKSNAVFARRRIKPLKVPWGYCGNPVVKVSDHGRHVMSSSPVPPNPPCRSVMHVESVES
ncbi:hypothetical protein TNCV_2673491 [Trichonephila clavipes]|nr:hypothetical protein TNCV_2673491 [Trichonephila clavipes]